MRRLLFALIIIAYLSPVAIAQEEPVLRIYGAVENPINITYSEFQQLPMVLVKASTICVGSSDPPGSNSFVVYTYNWEGVRLIDLLELVEPTGDAVDVKFGDLTSYSSSISLAEIIRDDMIIAVMADGETLTRQQGYPFRVVLPCYWGYKWVKYVEYIEVTDFYHEGFWESRGYPDDGRIPDCIPVSGNPEVFTPLSFALMGAGVVLMVASVYLASRD